MLKEPKYVIYWLHLSSANTYLKTLIKVLKSLTWIITLLHNDFIITFKVLIYKRKSVFKLN